MNERKDVKDYEKMRKKEATKERQGTEIATPMTNWMQNRAWQKQSDKERWNHVCHESDLSAIYILRSDEGTCSREIIVQTLLLTQSSTTCPIVLLCSSLPDHDDERCAKSNSSANVCMISHSGRCNRASFILQQNMFFRFFSLYVKTHMILIYFSSTIFRYR